MINKKINELTNKFYDEVVDIRHEIHMNPEIGFEELNTSRLVKETLEKYNIPYTSEIAKTGVLGILEGKNPGKTVLLRADMDALALQEDSGVEYSSKIPNRMHACGHDGHTAGLLGAAMVLSELRNEFDGTIKFMFQPAEETDGGALPMIEEGILENPKVDAAFACHLMGDLVEDQVRVSRGAMMAAPDTFEINILGKGGHGASPHMAIDPITISAYVITMLQSVVSRRIDPLHPVVITVGSISGGEAHNAIPNSVRIYGTVRTLNEKVRKQVPIEMENVVKGVASTHGADYEFNYKKIFPVLINDSKMADLARGAFSKVVGKENVAELEQESMGGEDFAFIAQNVPSAFVYVGIAKDEENLEMHHNPSFKWDDKNLKNLSKGYSQMAIDFLNN